MKIVSRILLAFLCVGVIVAARQISPNHPLRIARLRLPAIPWLPGSRIPLQPQGLGSHYKSIVIGSGSVIGGMFIVPSLSSDAISTVVASDGRAIAAANVHLAAIPSPGPIIAVASYDNGIALHDPQNFSLLGVLAINGHPSDLAFGSNGDLMATDTDGTAALLLARSPWNASRISNVPFGDEIAYDPIGRAYYVTGRYDGVGGVLTRVTATSSASSVRVGNTPEGIAIDPLRHRVYVANTSDGTISVVDTTSLTVRRTFAAVPRVFGIALSSNGKTLYAVANQSRTSPFSASGYVAAFDVAGRSPHMLTRSRPLTFPIGVVADSRHGRIFVTDEEQNSIDVLNANSLRPMRPPIATCKTPWKPSIMTHRLYIPCARSNAIDVIALSSLRRVRGAPFATAGYPLAVHLWSHAQ